MKTCHLESISFIAKFYTGTAQNTGKKSKSKAESPMFCSSISKLCDFGKVTYFLALHFIITKIGGLEYVTETFPAPMSSIMLSS
jgi:hypothetical protein